MVSAEGFLHRSQFGDKRSDMPERGKLISRITGRGSSQAVPPVSPPVSSEYIIGADNPPTEYKITQSWSPITPMQESDVRPLLEAFKSSTILETVHNETFNSRNVPRDWHNTREVDRFAALAKKFWLPDRPLQINTITPDSDGKTKGKAISVPVSSYVIRVDGKPAHAFRILHDDPYASDEEREMIEKGELRVAHQESMFTLPQYEHQGIASFGTIQTYDMLLGKSEERKGSFDRVSMLVNLQGSNTANFFMKHGFEIFFISKAEEDGGQEKEAQSVIRSTQDGREVSMLRLMLTQRRWLRARGARVDSLLKAKNVQL